VNIKCTSHISIILAICVPKIIKFCGDLTMFRQKQVGTFFLAHPVHYQEVNKMIFTVLAKLTLPIR